MGLVCSCPRGAAIPDITMPTCPENLGQIQKVIFQRVYSTGTTKNKFTVASADIDVLASWTPLLAAEDGTKVVQSPFLENPTSEAGGVKTFGGGNATLGGIPIVVGADPSKFTAVFNQCPQSTIKELKEYQCENVGVFFVDENGKILALSDGLATPAYYYPIPIKNLFIGDKKLGGFEEPDSNVIEFYMPRNWSDNVRIITPSDFDALNDLATPAGS